MRDAHTLTIIFHTHKDTIMNESHAHKQKRLRHARTQRFSPTSNHTDSLVRLFALHKHSTYTHSPAQHPPAAGLDYKVIIFGQTIISPPFHPLTLPLLCSCGAPRSLKHNPTLLPILPSASNTTPSLAPFPLYETSSSSKHEVINQRLSPRDLTRSGGAVRSSIQDTFEPLLLLPPSQR